MLNRERQRKHREKQKRGALDNNKSKQTRAIKWKAKSGKREYNKIAKQKQRSKMHAQKRRRIKEYDASYRKERRRKIRESRSKRKQPKKRGNEYEAEKVC